MSINTNDARAKEPWHEALLRVAREGWRSGLLDSLSAEHLAPLAQLVLREGLSVRTVHAMHAIRRPDHLALADANRQLTYAQANAEINQVAHALRHRYEVAPRDAVALMMQNRVEYMVCWAAMLRLGARAVHVSWHATPEELVYLLTHSKARVLIVEANTLEVARAACAQLEQPPRLLCLDAEAAEGVDDVEAYAEVTPWYGDYFPARVAREVSGDNVVYTSGTTGRPKGTLRDFTSVGVVELARLLERLPLRSRDRHLLVAPIYHSAGQTLTLLYGSLGATTIMLPRFEAEATLEAIAAHRITSIMLVPTMLRRLLELPEEVWARHDLSSLRLLSSFAAPFPHELRLRAMSRFPQTTICDAYGATELGIITVINEQEMRERPGSVGRALAAQEIGIFSEDGRRLGPGEVGLIRVRNQQLMQEYLDNPEATADIASGGWMTVEDLGYLDADGYLFLAGRERDMVISGGVNIYPVEIEDALVSHPAVIDAAVIGAPDEAWGERLVGFVVIAPGQAVEVGELERFARQKLASYKVPREWYFVDFAEGIPRNPTGKILKRQLRERLVTSRADAAHLDASEEQ